MRYPLFEDGSIICVGDKIRYIGKVYEIKSILLEDDVYTLNFVENCSLSDSYDIKQEHGNGNDYRLALQQFYDISD